MAECEKLAQISSQGLRDQLAEVEAEVSRLRQSLAEKEGEVTQLKVLSSLNQETALRLGRSMDALKRVLQLLVQDHQKKRLAFREEI